MYLIYLFFYSQDYVEWLIIYLVLQLEQKVFGSGVSRNFLKKEEIHVKTEATVFFVEAVCLQVN